MFMILALLDTRIKFPPVQELTARSRACTVRVGVQRFRQQVFLALWVGVGVGAARVWCLFVLLSPSPNQLVPVCLPRKQLELSNLIPTRFDLRY